MAKRLPLSGTKRRAWQIVTLVIVGAAFALCIRVLIARIDSGAGLSRVGSSDRCEAAPGCEEAMAWVGIPGFVLLLLGAFMHTRIEGRSMFSRRRVSVSGKLKVIRRRSTTTTRYRSTWDGPVVEDQTASRHEADDPLSPAEADQLIEMLEDPQFEVVVEGAGSEDEARQHLVAMLGDRANLAPTGDEPSRSSSTELPRSTAIGLMAAGATVALVYAQLLL